MPMRCWVDACATPRPWYGSKHRAAPSVLEEGFGDRRTRSRIHDPERLDVV